MIKINTVCVFLLLSLYLPSIKLKCLYVPCILRIYVDSGLKHGRYLPPTTFTFDNIVLKNFYLYTCWIVVCQHLISKMSTIFVIFNLKRRIVMFWRPIHVSIQSHMLEKVRHIFWNGKQKQIDLITKSTLWRS